MKHEFHYGKRRFEKRSGEKYMFVENAPQRAQPKQRSRNYTAAHSLQVSNQ
jgi:hypothetical protein